MKATVLFVSIMALCLLIIPMIALNFTAEQPSDVRAETPVHAPAASLPSAPEPDTDTPPAEETPPVKILDDDYDYEDADDVPLSSVSAVTSFKILDEVTGEVGEVSVRDFVRGAVAAEMPASFHPEALKAQAVAAHTFALHNHLINRDNPDPELGGADFSADPSNMKVYITESAARKFYGDDADSYWDKICEAADSVTDYVLEYDDEPIVAAYHAISSGMTEDAANIWTGSAPYLLPVKSEGDTLAPGYESVVALSDSEVESRLKSEYPGITLSNSPEYWFGEPERSGSGYVTGMEVGDMPLHGKDVRRIFGLRSHDFEIEHSDGQFIFTVTGYGHGVGLSQYGANYLANQGLGFDEILEAYYTGATLKRTDE